MASTTPVHPPCPSLSVIIPVYNEGDNFAPLVERLEQHLVAPKLAEQLVVLVVYDFDEDTTLSVARLLAETRPWLRLVRNTYGRGVLNAIRFGFAQIESGPVLVAMADLSDDLTIVPRMLELYRDGFQIVCPSRYMRGGKQFGGPLVKRTLSRLAGVSLWCLGFPTHDATNNFRLYDAALVRRLKIESTGGFELALELTAKAHRQRTPIAELPTQWSDRTAGESRFRLFHWLPRYLKWYFFAVRACLRRQRK